MKHAVLDFLRTLAVSNIALYNFVRTRVAFLNFMLPHDDAFFGLAYFGDGEGLFLDIGANDGLSARSYRKLVKNRPILSVEPNPLHEPALISVQKCIDNFSYRLVAASNSNSTLRLFTPVFKGIPLTNYTSSDMNVARQNLSTHMRIRDIADRVSFVETDVPAEPIDSMGLSPDLVKIDVEGFEAQVIAGMRNTIQRSQPVIMVEYNPASFSAVAENLTQLGYSTWDYCHKRKKFLPFNENNPPLNVFFLPNSSEI